MMTSIAKYIIANLAAYGLASELELKLVEKPKNSQLTNGGKWLTMLGMRTLPDNTQGVAFGNRLAGGLKGERFLTLVEFECKCRALDPSADFLWNTARQFRDKVYNSLAGTSRGGIIIPRYDWTDPVHPVQAGEIWFEVNPKRGTPMEDPVEDPNDPANKSIFLTYNAKWWRPVT